LTAPVPLAARQLLDTSVPSPFFSSPASASTLPALTASHWAPKPWSEVANVVGAPPISSRPSASVASASAYASFRKPSAIAGVISCPYSV
jgi:hypothetical protein